MISSTRLLGISFERRRTRRWAVALYWFWVLVFSGLFLRHQAREGLGSVDLMLLVFSVVNLSALLGGVRSGGPVKPFHGIHWAPLADDSDRLQSLFRGPRSLSIAGNMMAPEIDLDERDAALRDRIHFVAYTLCRWLALLLFGIYAALSIFNAGWLVRVSPLFFFLLALTLWSLPQSIILWNEPDVVEAEA